MLSIHAAFGATTGALSELATQMWVDGASLQEVNVGKVIGAGVTSAISSMVSFGIGTVGVAEGKVAEWTIGVIFSISGSLFGWTGGEIVNGLSKQKQKIDKLGD